VLHLRHASIKPWTPSDLLDRRGVYADLRRLVNPLWSEIRRVQPRQTT
jgi:hypothetical protein